MRKEKKMGIYKNRGKEKENKEKKWSVKKMKERGKINRKMKKRKGRRGTKKGR
jgi:hypothetical protein